MPTSATDRNGNKTQFTYDQYGNVLTVTNPRNTVTTYTYDYSQFSLGRLTSVQKGTKSATTFDYYEPSGLVHDIYRPKPGTTGGTSPVTATYTYDALGNVLTAVGPGNGTVSSITTTFNYTSDAGDAPHGVPALTGQTAAMGQPLTAKDNLGYFSHFRYDLQGHLVTTYDALGNRTDYNYIEPGQTVALAGQLQSVTLPATGQTGSGRGQVKSVYQYLGGPLTSTTTLDESGNAIRQVVNAYGPEGELLSVTGSTEPVSYTYDALYRLKTLKDAAQNTTSYFYNTVGYLAQVVYPGAQSTAPTALLTAGHADTVSYTSYDNDGNVLTRVDGRNQTTTYAYTDPESLLTKITYPTSTIGNVALAYDAYGRRKTMTDGTGGQTYTYDDDDNLTQKSVSYTAISSSQPVSYTYNPDGSRAGMVVSSQNRPWTYTYDGVGRLKTVVDYPSETTTYGYQANGWLQTKMLSNGIVATNTRDTQGRITDLVYKLGTTTLSDFAVPATNGYDGVGNRLSVTSTLGGSSPANYTGTTSYQYDYGQSTNPQLNRSQVTQEASARNGSYTNVFGYDGSTANGPGNPTAFKGGTRTFNSDNQLTNTGLAYDGAGNPTTYRSTALTFDPENRMTSDSTGSQTNAYNGDGLRAWKQAGSNTSSRIYFLYDGDQPVMELTSTGGFGAANTFGADGLASSRRFSPGNGTVCYLFDERGNVSQRTDSTGAVTGSDLYDAYGTRTGTAAPSDPFGFEAQAGYYTDTETGLVLCTHRFYDPGVGRFLTRDPLGYEGGINLYAYTENNPINKIDFLGLFGWQDVVNILGKGLTRGISVGGSGWFVTAGGGFDVGFASDQSGTIGITYDYWGGSGIGSIGVGASAGTFFSPGSLGNPDANGTVQSSSPYYGIATSLPVVEPVGGGSITGGSNNLPTVQVNTPGRPYYAATIYGHSGFFGINPWAAVSSLFTGKSYDPFSTSTPCKH